MDEILPCTVAFTCARTHDPILYSVPPMCSFWCFTYLLLGLAAADNVKAASMFTPKSVPIQRAPGGGGCQVKTFEENKN